jgi:hypothetical protein
VLQADRILAVGLCGGAVEAPHADGDEFEVLTFTPRDSGGAGERISAKPSASLFSLGHHQCVAEGHAVVMSSGARRSVSLAFMDWDGYLPLWTGLLDWLGGGR